MLIFHACRVVGCVEGEVFCLSPIGITGQFRGLSCQMLWDKETKQWPAIGVDWLANLLAGRANRMRGGAMYWTIWRGAKGRRNSFKNWNESWKYATWLSFGEMRSRRGVSLRFFIVELAGTQLHLAGVWSREYGFNYRYCMVATFQKVVWQTDGFFSLR